MMVDYNAACLAFARLPACRRSPYLSPSYVRCDARREPGLEPVFFVYEEGEHIFYHAYHLGRVAGTDFNDLQSPYAYGGPLSTSAEPGFLRRAWEAHLSWCQENRIMAEFVRFHPLLENWNLYQGESWPVRETVWLDITEEDLVTKYAPRVRTALRKAEKSGLRFMWAKDDDAYQIFTNLYFAAMHRLAADSFYLFPPDYFQGLHSLPQSHLALVLQDDVPLAGAVFLTDSCVMEYHLAASTREGNRFNASTMILHQAALLARSLGCHVLHLGGGTDNRPDNSLFFFKSGFSHLRAVYHIGRTIHFPDQYAQLRRLWLDAHHEDNGRVLFYRSPLACSRPLP